MPLELPDPYAEASDLAQYWHPLTDDEQARATNLLKWAALRIEELPGSEQFDELVCAEVSLIMVKRAMINGDGVTDTTTSQTLLSMTASATSRFANPMGNLYVSAGEAARLAGRTGQRGGSLQLTSNVRVPADPWNQQPSAQVDDAGH